MTGIFVLKLFFLLFPLWTLSLFAFKPLKTNLDNLLLWEIEIYEGKLRRWVWLLLYLCHWFSFQRLDFGIIFLVELKVDKKSTLMSRLLVRLHHRQVPLLTPILILPLCLPISEKIIPTMFKVVWTLLRGQSQFCVELCRELLGFQWIVLNNLIFLCLYYFVSQWGIYRKWWVYTITMWTHFFLCLNIWKLHLYEE